VLREAALFRRFIDDIIWIATSKLSKEIIRQALTSAFANSGLELTFRQAWTADQKREVEFLDVNHCITTDDDFGFVTKDFVKPTAEGRQFINRKSHHPQSTFQSILFGEAIRLRRLNQRKEDYLSNLNRLKEKATRSSFPLYMTNDVIAMASHWEERLWTPTGDRKEDPQIWVTSKKGNKLKIRTKDQPQLGKNCKRLHVSRKRNSKMCQGLLRTSVVAMENK